MTISARSPGNRSNAAPFQPTRRMSQTPARFSQPRAGEAGEVLVAALRMTVEVERQHYNVTFALLAAAAVSYALLQSLVAPALPDIQQALHTSESSVTWVLTAYLLSASIATPLIGRLGDIHGKERLLVILLVALCVGTVICALATSLGVMLVGRVLQGGAGGIFPLAFGIIRDEF